MKVSTMIEWLSQFDGESDVLFTPRNCCSGGWPEWTECHIKNDVDYDDEDNPVPTGTVIIEVSHEVER